MRLLINNRTLFTQRIRTSYNKRNVRYEKIHNLDENLLCDFVALQDIEDGAEILDHGCGYGAVTKEICKHFKNYVLHFTLQDISSYQIKRAKNELKGLNSTKTFDFHLNKLKDCHFGNNQFDTAFSKLVLQEMEIEQQEKEIVELKRIVKDDGYIIVWILWLVPEIADFIRDVIKEKDKIAGLSTLVANRHFTDSNEIITMLTNVGYNVTNEVQFISTMPLIYESVNQLSGDFLNDSEKLEKFHNFTRKKSNNVSKKVLKTLKYIDYGNNIVFNIPQMIIKFKSSK